jgi:CHRD domain/PEP-CTERM motif
MKRVVSWVSICVCAFALAAEAVSAQTFTFEAFLTGSDENPPNASPATGFGTVIYDAGLSNITVNESWSGLTAPATASHIHGPAGVGTNAPVLFALSSVPNATAGAIPEQTFSITPAQVADLFNGLYYMNVHTSTFPGGEIRGQLILVPEPSTVLLVVFGLVGLCWKLRRR